VELETWNLEGIFPFLGWFLGRQAQLVVFFPADFYLFLFRFLGKWGTKSGK